MSKKTKSKPTILNVPLKRPTPGDLEAAKGLERSEMADVKATKSDATAKPSKEPELLIHKFPDGAFLKFAINPLRPKSFILYDGKNIAYAAANEAVIANLICNSVNFALSYQQAQQEKQAASAAEMADGLQEGAILDDAASPPPPTAGDKPSEQPTNVVSMAAPAEGVSDGQT